MDSKTFLEKVAEALDYEEPITKGQSLDEIEMWDSLGILSIVDLLEELGTEIDIDALGEIETTDELIALAGAAVSD